MRTAAFVLCLALSALAGQTAAAKPLTVKLKAHVTQWADWSGTAFNGQIALGQVITLTYTYDDEATDRDASPGIGDYYGYYGQRPRTGEVGIRVTAGHLVFETVPTPQTFSVSVRPSSSWSNFSLSCGDNHQFGAGLSVDLLYVGFQDAAGQAPATDALPTDAPDLQRYSFTEVRVDGGNNISGAHFEIRAQVDSAEIVPPAIEVWPASGNFLTQQRFDAAVLVPVGSQIAGAHASTSGNALPLSYPGTCQLTPPNSLGRPALLCPDAHTVLGTAAGAPIDWHVELADGTVLDESVQWQLIQ